MISHWPGTDQGLDAHLFLSGKFPIALDYQSAVFQSWGLVNRTVEETAIQQGRTTDTIVRFDPSSELWLNSYTNAVPPILHFNADGKKFMERVITSQSYLSNLFFSFSNPFCLHIHKIIYGAVIYEN